MSHHTLYKRVTIINYNNISGYHGFVDMTVP